MKQQLKIKGNKDKRLRRKKPPNFLTNKPNDGVKMKKKDRSRKIEGTTTKKLIYKKASIRKGSPCSPLNKKLPVGTLYLVRLPKTELKSRRKRKQFPEKKNTYRKETTDGQQQVAGTESNLSTLPSSRRGWNKI